MTTLVSDEVVEVARPRQDGSPGESSDAGPPRPDADRDGRWPPLRHLRRHVSAEAAGIAGLLAVTAFCYLWGLDREGWANSFYAAAVEAATKSWKAFFFGSFDSSNFITVDKPPASLWVMDLSARLFGLSSWSLLVPQALEGVASVALLYRIVRRWYGWRAGLLAGLVLASTPVAALMFRYDNPDSLLVLVLLGATWATMRAIEAGRTRFLVLAGSLVGLGFITKMLQAFVILPALGLAYLICGPHRIGRRIRQLLAAGLALIVSAGWWVAVVSLVPVADRPYIGGSTDNSELNLIFGYNGFGRLTGHETGAVTAVNSPIASGTTSMWGPTGWDRMFLASFGGQISWLLPAGLVFVAAGIVLTWHRPRTDRLRAAVVLFGGTLVITGIVFSLSQGIIHPYYSVALAPSIGAAVAIGATLCWRSRERLVARALAALVAAGTAAWSFVLLDRSPGFVPALRVVVLLLGAVAALGLLGAPRLARSLQLGVASCALAVALAGPVAYTIDTIGSVQTGALPSAGPVLASSFGGPGGGGGFGGGGGRFGGFGGRTGGPAGTGGTSTARGSFPGGSSPPGVGSTAGGSTAGAAPSTGTGAGPGPAGGFGPPGGFGGASAGGRGGFGSAGGNSTAGGLLEASKPGQELVTLLESGAKKYTWVAATVGANSAAGYQLATDDAVMAIGGFNGTDPAPSLAQLEKDVSEHKIHYFIAGGGGAGPAAGASQSSSSFATQITSWVEQHYSARTVDGVTVYDLSGSPAS